MSLGGGCYNYGSERKEWTKRDRTLMTTPPLEAKADTRLPLDNVISRGRW